jgi:hypothetical protein
MNSNSKCMPLLFSKYLFQIGVWFLRGSNSSCGWHCSFQIVIVSYILKYKPMSICVIITDRNNKQIVVLFTLLLFGCLKYIIDCMVHPMESIEIMHCNAQCVEINDHRRMVASGAARIFLEGGGRNNLWRHNSWGEGRGFCHVGVLSWIPPYLPTRSFQGFTKTTVGKAATGNCNKNETNWAVKTAKSNDYCKVSF